MTQFTRFPMPQYDGTGELMCVHCRGKMLRIVSRNGDGYAVCNNLGCHAYGIQFLEGSEIANPSRTR